MNIRGLASVIFIFVLFSSACPSADQRLTTFSSVSLDAVAVPQQLWNSVVLDTQSIIKFEFLCREGISTTGGVRYQVELDNGAQHYTTTQYESTKTFINLPKGHYSLVVRAQSNVDEWNAVPTSLQFSVDPERATSFRNELQSSIHSEEEPWWKSNVFLASVFLALILGIVILLLMRTRAPAGRPFSSVIDTQPELAAVSTVAAQIKEQKSTESKEIKSLTADLQRMRDENQRLNHRIGELSKKMSEMDTQNQDLEEQIERVSKVKKELEDLQQQKDDVFAIIIHDIKNPASLIKNLVDLLRGYDLNSMETQEVMQDIVDTTTKIVSLSQELSRVMALDQVETRLDIQEADTAMLIESVCRRNSASAEKKGIRIEFDVPPSLPQAEIDSQKIEEVLDNLVSNAVKFSLPGTTINVRVIPMDDQFAIEVTDQGLGMSKEDTQKAFQRGMKLSARPTADEPSSGLGLWIVKRLVEAHNGRVSVKSQIGIGTTFTVTLPYKSEQLAELVASLQ